MKSILITGSSRGLGKELSMKFSRDKVYIILQGRDKDKLFQVREEILKPGWANCDLVAGDLRRNETIRNLYDLCEQQDLDILINNAGVRASGSLADMSDNDIEDMIEINLLSTIRLTKALYPIFVKKKSGLIININSIAGTTPNAEEAVYCASKYGMRGFFDSFRFEAKRNNVNILNIYLGAMNTIMAGDRPDKDLLIDPTEVAAFIHNIVSEYKSFRISELHLWRENF